MKYSVVTLLHCFTFAFQGAKGEERGCIAFSRIADGLVSCNAELTGDKKMPSMALCQFQCNEPYEVSGSSSIYCKNGVWYDYEKIQQMGEVTQAMYQNPKCEIIRSTKEEEEVANENSESARSDNSSTDNGLTDDVIVDSTTTDNSITDNETTSTSITDDGADNIDDKVTESVEKEDDDQVEEEEAVDENVITDYDDLGDFFGVELGIAGFGGGGNDDDEVQETSVLPTVNGTVDLDAHVNNWDAGSPDTESSDTITKSCDGCNDGNGRFLFNHVIALVGLVLAILLVR